LDDRIRELNALGGKPRLLDQVREQIRLQNCSTRTERTYYEWGGVLYVVIAIVTLWRRGG